MKISDNPEGLTTRQAALVAGLSMLVMSAVTPFAEFFVFPKLIVAGNIEQTVQNLVAHRGLFIAGMFGYLINFICDVLAAWALYVLLLPVNRALSLLTAWFRLIYTAIGLVALLNLVTAFRLLESPDYLTVLGPTQLHAQVKLLLGSFRYEWSTGLLLFEVHLVLLGYLVFRSGYIPKILGILLAIDGLGWLVDSLKPYLYPSADLGLISITFFGELVLMVWLLARGPRLPDAVAHP